MADLSEQRIQEILADEIAARMKQGWQTVGVGPSGAVMARSKPKHNGFLGSVLLAPLSLGLSVLWSVARNLDRKSQGLTIQVNPDGSITTELVDYEQMMAQLEVQKAVAESKNPESK